MIQAPHSIVTSPLAEGATKVERIRTGRKTTLSAADDNERSKRVKIKGCQDRDFPFGAGMINL